MLANIFGYINLEPLFYTLVGFALGLLGTLFVEYLKRRRLKNDLKEGLLAQLKEAQPILTASYFILKDHLGQIDLETLRWLHSMKIKFEELSPELTQSQIEALMKSTEGEWTEVYSQLKATKPKGREKHLKKINLTFLENNLHSISLLDSNLQRSILDIWTKVNWLNEEVQHTNFYFQKSFDSSLSPHNWDIIKANLKESYEGYAELCRRIAELNGKIISELSK